MPNEPAVNINRPDPLKGHPWAAVEPFIPDGFLLTPSGVFLDRDKAELISGVCWVSSLTRSHNGEEWGRVVHWIDRDGNQQSRAFADRKFHMTGSPLVADLASLGLHVVPGKDRQLMRYLGGTDLPPAFRQRSVAQLGWQDNGRGTPLFVLPDRVIGQTGGERVVFQPDEYNSDVRGLNASGSLPEWNRYVAQVSVNNPLFTFTLCAGLAGPLLRPSGLDSGGFHFYGASSKGKTTALQVAASVWGCGADPAASPDSYISRWNTTGNALEATAASHNDLVLPLDEMGTFVGKDFGATTYNFFGGQGKARMTKASTLQTQRTWRMLGLSTGEISVRQKIEEEPGRKSKTGQLIRLVDVPVSPLLTTSNSGRAMAQLVNDLKASCASYYGAAGPAFVEALVANYPNDRLLNNAVREQADEVERDLTLGRALESYQTRGVRRFALVGAAGILAVHLGVLALSEAEIRSAVHAVWEAWLNDDSNKPEGVRAVEAIKATILRDRARFRPLEDKDRVVRDLLGYEDQQGGCFLFTDAGFAEACQGLSCQLALEELQSQGLLFMNEAGRKKAKQKVPGVGRIRVYVVRAEILEVETFPA